MQDLYIWLNGAMFTAVAGFALLRDDHVRVDIFYRPASPRRKAVVDLIGVLLFLVRVLQEFLGSNIGVDTISTEIVAFVTQGADNFGRQRFVKNLHHIVAVGTVALGKRSFFDVLAGPLSEGFHVGQKRLIGHNVSLVSLIDLLNSA